MRFGGKLREVRANRGMTLAEVARRASVSSSLLSQVERDRVSPALDTLLRILEVLELDISYLFRETRPEGAVTVSHPGKRRVLSFPQAAYEQLSESHLPEGSRRMELLRLVLPPGGCSGSDEYGHPGKEVGYILRGRARFSLGGEAVELRTGDCVTFTSRFPHRLENAGSGELEALWILNPPRGERRPPRDRARKGERHG